LQVGNDELFELGQSGWAGAKYNPVPKITKKINDDITFVDNSGEVIKTINDEVKKESIVDNGEQLTNIVNYLYNIAKKEKIHFSSLWLPSLANEIYYGNLVKKYRFESDILKKNVVIGEYDNPSKQLQGLYQLNLVGENTIIFGMPGSGKENLLTTMMFSACINYSPFDVEFYILDFGAEVLKVFKNMPHVGDIIDVDSMDKISILFQKLEKEVKRRKELFADYAGDYVSYCRNNQDKIPLIVVVINSYESFMENTNSDYDDYLSHLLRECSKYGITIILSAVATNSVRTSFLDNFRNKILLQVQDNFDYVYMLGASNGLVPKKNFGRGIVNIDDEACEFQSALINVKDEINTYVKSIGNYLFDSYKYKVPEVRGLPALVTFNMIKKYVNNITDIPVGFGKEDCDIFRYNFEKNHFNVITGNDIISNVTCFGGIIDLIDLVRVVKMYVIDFADCINFEGNATFCNDNFGELLDIIIANARLSNEKIIYYMVGIGNISNVLSIEELKKFGMIMSNIDKFGNSYFIVVDDYDRYKNIYQYEWYKNINMGSGIWVGNDIDKQDIFNCSFSDDDINDTMKDIAYVVNNDNYVVIRTLGEGDDSDG
jgi:S-DNA-T family DNA segregation ATPase FtsK/SpoIIIE